MTTIADLRFAWRGWWKNPVPPLTAVLTLALGVGANTAIFSVIHAVMLKPLPYPQPDRLVQIWSVDLDPHSDLGAMTHRDKQLLNDKELDRLRELSRSFQDIGYYFPWMSNVSAPGDAERVYATVVSPGIFTTLRVAPVRGRAFTADDMIPGKDRVVILSDAFWHRRFHADPAALGKTITVDGFPRTVVGIMAPGFRLIAPSINEQPELLAPLSIVMSGTFKMNSAFSVGRLRPGGTLAAARAETAALARQLPPHESGPPGKRGPRGINLVPMDEEVASGIRPALLILFAAAASVLLIACGNIASLMLASTAGRAGELALRTALGARRGRLARQLLTESMALAVAGTALGLALSFWVVRAIVHLYPDRIPRLESLRPDPAVFAFTALLAVVTAVLVGGLPAWRYSRADVQQVLKGSSTGGRHGASRFRDLLMTAQIAATLVLLIGAGLLLRSFLLMRAIDPGFERHHLLIAHFMLDEKSYGEPAKQAAFVNRLIERMKMLPGVEGAGATNSMPLEFNLLLGVTVAIEGHPELSDQTELDCRAVTPHFLQTLGVGLVAGRFLEPADSAADGGVMVNQAFAKKYFGGANPVGRHLYFPPPHPIVGEIADIRDLKLERKTLPAMYVPFDRQPSQIVDLAVRTTADPKLLVNRVRAELRAIDPNQPLGKVTTMEDVLDKAVAKPRWYAILIGAFAGLAMLLAAVGIYGVVAYAVSRRTHEIGIRMAIGAQPRHVLRMVLLRGMLPPLAGVAIGLPLAGAACKVLASFLYGVKPLDAATYVAMAFIVPAVAMIAAYLPARRATKVDPIAALRCE
ncbi:MAG: ABC transporter permease [Bryobacteraceae bacterium]